MDLEEWELLSDECFIGFHEDHHGVNSISSKFKSNTTTVIDMNYFQKFSEPQNKKNLRVIPVPIKFDRDEKFEEIPKEEVTKLPIQSSQQTHHENQIQDKNFAVLEPKSGDKEMISKVFFKKLKETNEFVDMKMDLPKFLNRGLLPNLDVGTYQFDEKELKDGNFDKEKDEDDGKLSMNGEMKSLKIEKLDEDEDDHKDEGLNVWKWAMTGIGALVSFGFTAATVSFIVLNNRHNDKNNSKNKDLHFQIYSHDKRFKAVVRRAKRLNEAMSVMRGAPVNRAHITIGGYYEAV